MLFSKWCEAKKDAILSAIMDSSNLPRTERRDIGLLFLGSVFLAFFLDCHHFGALPEDGPHSSGNAIVENGDEGHCQLGGTVLKNGRTNVVWA